MKSFLIDTHILLWTITEPDKLGSEVISILENKNNNILVSSISYWEISIKMALGKFSLLNLSVEDIFQASKYIGFIHIPVLPEETSTFYKLPIQSNHKDPFDRMLIWQAIYNNLAFISRDESLKKYIEHGLNLIQ